MLEHTYLTSSQRSYRYDTCAPNDWGELENRFETTSNSSQHFNVPLVACQRCYHWQGFELEVRENDRKFSHRISKRKQENRVY